MTTRKERERERESAFMASDRASRPTMTAFLSLGSTYTYLTARRILKEIQKYDNVDIVVKVFSVRAVMIEQDNVPFPPKKEAKVKHMWRDIERRAARYGIEPKPVVPAPYPLREFDRANRVGIVLTHKGKFFQYLDAAYTLWFGAEQIEPGTVEGITRAMRMIGEDAAHVTEAAMSDDTKREYEANTKVAFEAGIFGAPSWIVTSPDGVREELFWGDDRLEDALECASEMAHSVV